MDKTKFVLWIASSTPSACEVYSHASGADVILVDAQHGAFGHDEAIKIVAAASSGKAECAVRVSDDLHAAEMCRYLDAGASTIVCPLVNDKAACERFVRSCYYPPKGDRSYGPYRHRILFKEGFSTGFANDRVTTLAMIETRKALENLEEILSVEGLSGVFIGPNDLGLSMGYQPTSSPQGEVLEAVRRIGKEARARGKVAGIFCMDIPTAIKMRQEGFNFIVYGSDINFVNNGSNEALTRARM